MRKKVVFLQVLRVVAVALLALPTTVTATSLVCPTAALPQAAAIDAVVKPIDQEQHIEVGVRIEDLDGEVLYDYFGKRNLVLASNNKLFTTSAALLALPPTYRWHTRSYLSGQKDLNSQAVPVLRVVGGGDPSMRMIGERDVAEEFLQSLAMSLQEAGVSQLAKLEIDASYFDQEWIHPLWPHNQLNQTYCAPLSALSLNGGCLQVNFLNGHFTTTPPLGSHVRWSGQGRTNDSLSAWTGTSDFDIVTRAPANGRQSSVSFAMKDPLLIFGTWLQEGLRRHGLTVDELLILDAAAIEATPSGDFNSMLVHDWASAWDLAEVVVACNKASDNFLAECLLKTVGREIAGEGSYEAGRKAIQEVFAAEDFGGLVFSQADGSGMAREAKQPVNTSTPSDLCLLLREMALREQGVVLFDSLPIAGVEGRLGNRFKSASFQPQRVHAKTGYISGASSLSGYLLMPDDQVVVFSIVVNFNKANPNTNNARFKKMQEALLEELLRSQS